MACPGNYRWATPWGGPVLLLGLAILLAWLVGIRRPCSKRRYLAFHYPILNLKFEIESQLLFVFLVGSVDRQAQLCHPIIGHSQYTLASATPRSITSPAVRMRSATSIKQASHGIDVGITKGQVQLAFNISHRCTALNNVSLGSVGYDFWVLDIEIIGHVAIISSRTFSSVTTR